MADERRVTIRDVARETGLALSTVSNALAGKALVRPETRELVLKTAERLGYRASIVARSLRSQRSFAIGVLIEDVANPSASAFVRGIEDATRPAGYTIFLANTDGKLDRQIAALQALVDRQVDGLVLISQHVHEPMVQNLLNGGIPSVLLQRRHAGLALDYVGSDNAGGILEALHYIHRIGHRRVGFVTGPMMSSSARERLQAYRGLAVELVLDDIDSLIFEGEYSFENGLAAAGFFSRLARPPSCILASNDMNAMGLMQGLAERGLRCPADISVVGLDDIDLAALRAIDLTTIRLEKRTMGADAGRILLDRIADPARPIETRIHPTRLVVRGTTAPPHG